MGDAFAALTKRIRNAKVLWRKLCNSVPEMEWKPEKKVFIAAANSIKDLYLCQAFITCNVTPGAYSPCMQGMHCMPSHLAKKENNNLNKYM